jgi:hypothetical protein
MVAVGYDVVVWIWSGAINKSSSVRIRGILSFIPFMGMRMCFGDDHLLISRVTWDGRSEHFFIDSPDNDDIRDSYEKEEFLECCAEINFDYVEESEFSRGNWFV